MTIAQCLSQKSIIADIDHSLITTIHSNPAKYEWKYASIVVILSVISRESVRHVAS